MKISNLPLATNPTSTDVLPLDRNGITYKMQYQALQGPQGPQGATGPKGDTGATGPGLAAGGTAGQVVVKKSSTDYDTEWKTLADILPYALTCVDSSGELIVTITSQT